MKKQFNKSGLEIVCGSMFSGKSEELIRRLKRAEYAKLNVLAFKHNLDNRTTIDHINAHSGEKMRAIAVEHAHDIKNLTYSGVDVIGIDEVQFFSKDIVNIILDLVQEGKRVIAAGLDLDFRGVPFGSMPVLMAVADTVTKLSAVCISCGADAHFTQRLINDRPAKFSDPIIMPGAQEYYQARCRDCFIIDQKGFSAELTL